MSAVEVFARVDIDWFHTTELRERIAAGNGAIVAAYSGDGRAIAFTISDLDRSWTYQSTGTTVEIVDGVSDNASVVVELDSNAFCDLITERWSAFGLVYQGRAELGRGSFDHLGVWEPALQALFFGRPIYGPDTAPGLDREVRSFTFGDDPAEMSAALHRWGFLHVKSVFSDAEMATLRSEVARYTELATPTDGISWWATDSNGVDRCCRLTYLNRLSPAAQALGVDQRLAELATLTGIEMQPTIDRLDGVSCVMKQPDIVTGLSDLPWHRDCGMGGHPVLCPALNIGVQLDPANAENGQLKFLVGSSHHANPPLTESQVADFPIVAVETEPGDCTLHFGHTMHVAPPPTSPTANRRSIYVQFATPAVFDVIGPGQSFNDVLFEQSGDGHMRPPAEA